MPVVWIPALLRELTGGQAEVEAPGETVEELIRNLDLKYPGIKDRLIDNDRLIPSLTLVVDGVARRKRLRQSLHADSEVHFLPVISGGLDNLPGFSKIK
jgi:molybdopterin converting factor small subunit